MKPEIIAQIFSGAFLGKSVPYETVEQKLLSALRQLPVSRLIMGWSPDKALYEKTAAFLARRNIGFFLWFPVFSETGSFRKLGGLTDFRLRAVEGGGGNADEDFSFCCPNNRENIEGILDIYEREFSSIPFTGIFLDKIRFPSFAQGTKRGDGFKSVFSCFCPHCLEKYQDKGFHSEQLKEALSRPASVPLGITEYRGGGSYSFEDPVISAFFSLKGEFIYQSLSSICRYFRGKGLEIGFDVFAPFLSPFTGQDLPALSALCDFMKPMMYRATLAPAGLPYETEMLLAETAGGDAEKKRRFYGLLGLRNETWPFDLPFAVKELKSLASSSACPVYAGLEINRKEKIAEVYPAYIRETIDAYGRTGSRGLALSWDLLDAPEENITAVADAIKKITL